MFADDRGKGSPVLFIHGQPGLGCDFDVVSEMLVEDHRVISPDRPGYGTSARDAVSMRDNAKLFAALLEERSAIPATVVGHSYGGGIAVLLAAERPELVSGMVLVCSVGQPESLNVLDHLLTAPVLGDALSAVGLFTLGHVLTRIQGVAAQTRLELFSRLRKTLPDSRYVEVAAGRGRQIWRSFVFEQRSLVKEIGEVAESLEAIEVPTVVIAGAWDVVVPPSAAVKIAARLRNSQMVTLDQVGHFVLRDAPEAVAAAVRNTELRSSRTVER